MLIIHSSSPASARTAKPPLRSGDDAVEDSILNRRVIKKPRFQVRSDTLCARGSIRLLSAYPIANVGRAVAQFDAFGFAGCKKAHRILVHQLDAFEIEYKWLQAGLDLRFQLFQVFRLEPATQAQNHEPPARDSLNPEDHLEVSDSATMQSAL